MNKQLLRDFVTTRPALQELLKEALNNDQEQPVPATAKLYQMIKTIDSMKKLHQLMGEKTTWYQNGRKNYT